METCLRSSMPPLYKQKVRKSNDDDQSSTHRLSDLHQGLSEPEFYGDLVYKFKKIRGMTDFSDQFRKIIMRYKRIGYNLNVMRQSSGLVINPITVDTYAALFNCTPVDRASDSMMTLT